MCHWLDMQDELQNMKIANHNGRFHPQDCVERPHVPKKDGGRGLISVEDCVRQAKISLEYPINRGSDFKSSQEVTKGGMTMWLKQGIGTHQEMWVPAKWEVEWPCSGQSVLENDNCKLLCDFIVQTYHEFLARRPDLMILDKRNARCQIVSVPEDCKVREMEVWKVGKQNDRAK